MTYCVAIKVESGLVFCSDSRTNAGMDHVSTYSKMYTFGIPGERQIVLMSAGNLATTQSVLAKVRRDLERAEETNVLNLPSLRDVADYVGNINSIEQDKHEVDNHQFEATFILGGQIGQQLPHEIFLIYPEGNYISTSPQTPFLQIGESKYGKPILDRILNSKTNLATSAATALVSMDSTMRSNLTVGPPIEINMYNANSLQPCTYLKFEQDSPYLRELKKQWDAKIVEAFNQLPPLVWSQNWDQLSDPQDVSS
ncbi:MAG: peptidase [Pseudomonadota bacterium]